MPTDVRVSRRRADIDRVVVDAGIGDFAVQEDDRVSIVLTDVVSHGRIFIEERAVGVADLVQQHEPAPIVVAVVVLDDGSAAHAVNLEALTVAQAVP